MVNGMPLTATEGPVYAIDVSSWVTTKLLEPVVDSSCGDFVVSPANEAESL